jgi:hypothetical protein
VVIGQPGRDPVVVREPPAPVSGGPNWRLLFWLLLILFLILLIILLFVLLH